jgi:hypothetical protein
MFVFQGGQICLSIREIFIRVERESGEGGRGAHGKKLTNFCL